MNHEFFYDEVKFSTLEELEKEINKLNEVNLARFGEISDVILAALNAQVKLLYKEVIAKICGISKEEVTDEYIEIALEKTPVEAMNPDGTKSNELRNYYDDELKEKLKPLIERDRKKENESIQKETENKETNKLEEIFNKYWKLNELEDKEEKERKYYELREEAKQIAAEILGVQPSEIMNSLAHYMLEGFQPENLENGNQIPHNVPITEEQVKALYKHLKSIKTTIIYEEQPEEEIENNNNFHL